MSLNWNNVKPSCCAKWLVLPTVYSDALSYGEQLDKFCYQLNQLIDNNNILPDFIAEMIKEYINSGAIGEVVRDILADYILNVKYPPNGITPAVGDGSADDTDAIQGCIDYAAENGGVVYFPYGSYLTQPLTMKDGVSLFGFDRYSTKIVLKGGATKPLIGGTVADLSIANLTLDGNSGIQVNDVNVVTIMGTNVLFTNLIIKDGYTLVNYVGTGGNLQISDVVFGNAVEKCFLTTGNADVQCENVVFNQLSAVGGVSVMDIGTDGGFFNVKSLATCNQCIVVTGNNNKISAIVENAVIPVVDNGLQNNIEIFGISNKEFYSRDTSKEVNGNYSKRVGGTYTKAIDGNATENVGGTYTKSIDGNSTENVDGDYTKTIVGNETENVDGGLNTNVKGVTNETYKGDRTITDNNVTENAKDINILSENFSINSTVKTELSGKDIILNPDDYVTYLDVSDETNGLKTQKFKNTSGDLYNICALSGEKIGNNNFEPKIAPSWFTGVDYEKTFISNSLVSANTNDKFNWSQIILQTDYNYIDDDPTPNENFKKIAGLYNETIVSGYTKNTSESITQNITGVGSVVKNECGGLVGVTAVAGRYYSPDTSENIELYGGNKGNAVEGISFNDTPYEKGGYIIGAEFDVFDRVDSGKTDGADYENNNNLSFNRRSTGIIITGSSKTQPVSIGLLVQGSNEGGMWNGIAIGSNACVINGRNGVKGSVGINMSSWQENTRYGHTAIRFGHANRQIWAQNGLKIATNGTSFVPTQESVSNFLRLCSSAITGSEGILFGTADVEESDVVNTFDRKGAIVMNNTSGIIEIQGNIVSGGGISLLSKAGSYGFTDTGFNPIDGVDCGKSTRRFNNVYLKEIITNKTDNDLYNTVASKFRLSPGKTVNVIDFVLKCLNKCTVQSEV
nr:MAG TPA: baseplate hub subunit and tail lysozyme [Caudoviricetes sp.]